MQTKGRALMIGFVVAYALIFVVVWAALVWPAAALVSLAVALVGISLWRRQVARRVDTMPAPKRGDYAITRDLTDAPDPAMGALIDDTWRRDLSLAAEHVHSIRWLLEIARDHQQPIPTSALKNLELVSKNLNQLRQRIDVAREDVAPESAVSAVTHPPEPRTPPRPQPLSSGCHASPSDRSMPFD